MSDAGRPGSDGRARRCRSASARPSGANAFYDNQVLDHLTPEMREFMRQMTMAFIATSDAHGECDSSFRAGPPGFMRVIDEKTVMWPEYKGNGVMASMGNISENPYVGLLMVDFFETAVGLHVNGKATIVDNDGGRRVRAAVRPARVLDRDARVPEVKKTPERWVVVDDRRGLHPLLQAHPDARSTRRPDPLPFATALVESDETQEDARALGRRHDRRGLHPLLQAHPDAAAGHGRGRSRPPRR